MFCLLEHFQSTVCHSIYAIAYMPFGSYYVVIPNLWYGATYDKALVHCLPQNPGLKFVDCLLVLP